MCHGSIKAVAKTLATIAKPHTTLKIGLIFPNKDRKDKTVHLGLGYIASYARTKHNDLEFQILDTRVATKKECLDFFNCEFDLIGLTVLSPVYYEVIALCDYLRKTKPETPICLGGPYVTTIMDGIFKETPANYAVYGEGELTFSELLFFIKGARKLDEINGLMYKSQSGAISINPPREQITELDGIPIPAYDLFHMNRYPMHRIVTSRGCPYKCVFCNSSSIWLGKWRKRNVDDIINEIKYLIKTYKKKTFFLNDNSFNIDMKRVELFCNALIENKITILWSTPVRAECINDSLAALMKRAGCYNVGIGVESASNQVLERMQKKCTIEDTIKGIRIFKQAGIEVLGQFVIGSPGDTLETVKESIEFAKKSELDFVMFYSILPFKGTPQWDYVKEYGTLFHNSIHDYHKIKPRIVFETPNFPYKDRLVAINLAKQEGYYSDSNDRSLLFDLGRDIAKEMQTYLPYWISDKVYIFMKNVYRNKIWKKLRLLIE